MSIWATIVTAELLPLGMWLVIFSSVQKTFRNRVLLSGLFAYVISTLAVIGLDIALGAPNRWMDAGWVFELALGQMAAVGVGAILACYGSIWVQLPTVLLVSGVTAPLMVQWLWRGGWLATLGNTLNLGHGAIDLGGLSMIGLLIGWVALFAMLRLPRRTSSNYAGFVAGDTWAVAGALVFALGAGAIFMQYADAEWGDIVQAYQIRFGLASLVATLFVLAYGLFVAGKVNWIWQARAVLAAILICSAAAVTLPLWLAIGLGLVCGLLVTIGDFVINQVVCLPDPNAAVASILLPSVLGLLLVGLFANGSYGVGMNGVGLDQYLHMPNLGVVGLMHAPADPGQLSAQLLAVATLSGLTLLTTGPALWLVQSRLSMPTIAPETEQPIEVALAVPAQVSAIALDAAEASQLGHAVVPEITTADVLPDELLPRWPVASSLTQMATAESLPVIEDQIVASPKPTVDEPQPIVRQSPTKHLSERSPNILERLRQANQRNRPERPPARAARVAYPTRVAGKRLLRPIVEENTDEPSTPPSSAP